MPNFTYNDTFLIPQGWSIEQMTYPPANSTVNFNNWPATNFASFNSGLLVERSSWLSDDFEISHMIWGTRELKTSSNPTNAVGGHFTSRFSSYLETRVLVTQNGDTREARFNYNTKAKARAVTVAHVMRTCGYTDAEISVDPFMVAAGYTSADFLEWADFRANPELYCTVSGGSTNNPTEFWVNSDDLIWMPAARLVDVTTTGWVVIDYELQDGTSESETNAFVLHLSGLVNTKGFKLSIWPNSLGAAGCTYSGITAANASYIASVADKFSLLCWNDGNSVFTDFVENMWTQLNAGGPVDPSKITLTFSLGNPNSNDTTVSDAKWLRRFAMQKGIRSLKIWRNSARTGEDDPSNEVNRKVYHLLMGEGINRPSARQYY